MARVGGHVRRPGETELLSAAAGMSGRPGAGGVVPFRVENGARRGAGPHRRTYTPRFSPLPEVPLGPLSHFLGGNKPLNISP